MSDYTLIQSGDADAAENLGALAGDTPREGIVDGLAITNFDTAAPSIDVDSGKTVHVLDTATAEWSDDDGNNYAEQRDQVQIVCHVDARSGISLADGSTVHVFVEPNWSTDDSPSIETNTSGSKPSPDAVKVHEVDTSADTTSEQWGLINNDGVLTYPDATSASTALSNYRTGTAVIDRENGTRIVDGKMSAEALEADDQTINNSLTGPAGNTTTDLTKLGGKIYSQETEPVETPSPPPEGSGAVWYPQKTTVVGINNEWNFANSTGYLYGGQFNNGTVVTTKQNGTTFGLSLNDGSEEWSTTQYGELDKFAISGDTVVAHNRSDTVYGISLTDGSQIWSKSVSSPRTPIAINDTTAVFGTENGDVYALSLSDGSEQWSNSVTDSAQYVAKIVDQTVIIGNYDTNDYNGGLFAFSLADGSKQWDFIISDGNNSTYIQSGVAHQDGVLVFGSADSNIYGISLADGGQQWSFTTGDSVESGVAIQNGTAIAGSKDNFAYAINITDGTQKWSFDTGASIKSGIDIEYNTAVLGNDNGVLYGLSIKDGSKQWESNTTRDIFKQSVTAKESYVIAIGDGDFGDSTLFTKSQQTEEKYDTPKVSNGNTWMEPL